MQPVNTTNIQNQSNTQVRKESSEKNLRAIQPSANTQKGDAIKLPEDVVSLSAASQANSPFAAKEPSSPVTFAERKELYNSLSGKKGFSTRA